MARVVLPRSDQPSHLPADQQSVPRRPQDHPKWYSREYLAKVFARRPAQLLALLAFVIVAAILIYVFAAGQETNTLDLCSGTTNGTTCSGGQVTLNTSAPVNGTLSATPTLTAGFPENGSTSEAGRVDAVRRVGGTIYVGGDFTVARDLGASGTVQRHYLAAINASTGKLTSWDPEPNGRIYDIEPSADDSIIYVAGSFTSIAGGTRHDLAALDPTTGALISSFPDFNFSNFVWSIRIYGTTMYAGGEFSGSLAKINLATETRDATFKATASGSGSSPIKDLYLVPGTTRLVVAGWFTTLNGSSSSKYLSAVDSNTGATLAWASTPTQPILALDYYAPNNTMIVAGGGEGTSTSDAVSSFNATTGAMNWFEHEDGNIQAVTVDGNFIIGGTHGDCLAGKPGEPAANYQSSKTCTTSGDTDGLIRHKVFKLDAATGTPDKTWAPALTGGDSLGVWSLDSDANGVYAGGDFTSAAGQDQPRFALFKIQ
jgi:hypothetical protein